MPMRTRAWEDTVGYWTRFKWFTAPPINALQCAVQQIILGKLHKTLSVLWHWGGLSMYQFHQTTCFSRQAGTLSGIMRWFCTQEPKYWARMEFPFEMTHLSVKPFISNDSPFYKKPTVYRDWEGYDMWPSLNQPDPVFHSPLPPISFTQLLALISCYTNDDDIFCMVLKIVFTYPS